MTIPYYEVAAFTKKLFAGNPAGVCLLEGDWLPDSDLQKIAHENGLSETAFLVERGDYFDLRWMTPTVEVDLCGHATLASGHVLFNHCGRTNELIRFQSRSGELIVRRNGDRLDLDFPAMPFEECEIPEAVVTALGAEPRELRRGRDFLAVFEREKEVAELRPDLEKVAQLPVQGMIVTAPGETCDFVSRYFVPAAGIPEDPVTGSTHCTLVPYWSQRLGKRELFARQISARGGELFCTDRGQRIEIGGHAVTYVTGQIRLP